MDRRQLLLHLALPLVALAISSCVLVVGDGWDHGGGYARTSLRGSGVEIHDTRAVNDFERVRVSGGVDIELRRAEFASVEVVGDDNLVERVSVRVDDGTLVVELDDDYIYHDSSLTVLASTPRLAMLTIDGSSRALVEEFDGPLLELSINGSGDVRAAGNVESLVAAIRGSGDMDLEDLTARNASVRISGSGEVEVYAEERLDVVISGSGDVRYHGSPRTSVEISGSGSFERD